MSKTLISFLVIFSIHLGYSQTNQAPIFFAQCMIELNTPEEAQELTLSLRENPYVATARVDWPTKRVFILTKDITEFTESDFSSWLGTFSASSTCLQVGLHGVDVVAPYPFTNCND